MSMDKAIRFGGMSRRQVGMTIVKAALESQDMCPTELARLTGHSPTTVLRYRSGESVPSRAFLLDLLDKAPGVGFTFREIASPLGYRWVGSRDPRKFRRFGEFFSSVRVHANRNRDHFAIKLGVAVEAVRDVEHGLLPERPLLANLAKHYLPPDLNADAIAEAFPVLRPSAEELSIRATIEEIRSLGAGSRTRLALENELAGRLFPIARSMARKAGIAYGKPRDAEDVCGEAIVLAVKRQDPRRGLFFPYLKIVVRGLVRELNRMDMQSGVSAALRKHGFAYKEARRDLIQKLQREPTTQDLADYLDLPETVIFETARALDASFCALPENLESCLDRAVDLRPSGDTTATEEAQAFDRLLSLPDEQRELLFLHYYDNLLIEEVAERAGLQITEATLKLQWALAQLGG